MNYDDIEEGMRVKVTHGVAVGHEGIVDSKSLGMPTLAGTKSPPVILVHLLDEHGQKKVKLGKMPEDLQPANRHPR